VPAGRIVDRANKVNILVIGSLVVVASTFVIPFADTFAQLIIIFIVMGAGEAFVAPTLGAFAILEGRVYGQGAMMGVFNMSMSAGILVGSLAAGLLVDSYGVEYAFPFVAVALLISTIISALMIKAGSDHESEPGLPASGDGVASMSRIADD